MSENKKWGDNFTKAFVAGLNKSTTESVARQKRYGEIFEIEQKKWPHDMGSKVRDEVPSELQGELDECIRKSQIVARGACQTIELTEEYLKKNSHLKDKTV